MKPVETITEILGKHKNDLQIKYGVRHVGIFGSYLRDEQTRNSDVDVLVDFNRETDLFEFIELKQFLEKILRKKVDLVMKRALKPALKRQILKDVKYV